MTNPNHSHITMLCDRSGSMNAIREDAQGGVRSFIADQAAEPGTCSLLLVDFDSMGYDIRHDGPIGECPAYVLEPRGGTPLLDAMARAIRETGERLAALAEDERPAHVFFVVQTDGQENSSREIALEALTAQIKRQENEWKWNFIFLSTGMDAFAQSRLFVGTQMVANTVNHAPNQTVAAYAATSRGVSATRGGAADVVYGADLTES